jgi:carbonic anhydrase
MQNLIQGIHKFRQEELGRYDALFRRLSREGQRPHTLFITCSDSRVLAELITQSKPGDLFVVKNVGNIVPAVSAGLKVNSTAAAIEFAVQTIGVSDIVVCGHSLCGAMAALLEGVEGQEPMPHLQEWLELASPVRQLIQRDYKHLTTLEARTTAAAEENVLFALENLRTYPVVSSRLESGSLRLHGWFFKIATAEMFAYDPGAQQFQPISAIESKPAPSTNEEKV